MLKKLMGGSVTARRLYQNAAMLRNNAKFVFAANDVPATQDRSHGLFRRLIIAPFNKRFELGDNADPDILDKIIPEASGIFNRCLKAYKAVTIKGDFTECHAIATAVEEYRETVDRVGTWIKDNIHWNGSWKETDPCIRVEDAFERFFSYAKKNEEETCSRHQFTRHMRRVMDHWGERYVRSRNGGGERDYVVRGASFMDSPAVVHPETGASEAAPEGVDRF